MRSLLILLFICSALLSAPSVVYEFSKTGERPAHIAPDGRGGFFLVYENRGEILRFDKTGKRTHASSQLENASVGDIARDGLSLVVSYPLLGALDYFDLRLGSAGRREFAATTDIRPGLLYPLSSGRMFVFDENARRLYLSSEGELIEYYVDISGIFGASFGDNAFLTLDDGTLRFVFADGRRDSTVTVGITDVDSGRILKVADKLIIVTSYEIIIRNAEKERVRFPIEHPIVDISGGLGQLFILTTHNVLVLPL